MRNQNASKFLLTGRLLLALTFAGCLTAPMLAQQTDGPPPAQSQPPHGDNGDRQLDHMTMALNLTPDQVTQVRAIHADSRAKMLALRDDTSVAQPDKRAKMKAIHEDSEAKIKAILDDKQKAKYDEMQAHMREHRDERGAPHQGDQGQPPPPPQN